MHTPAKIEYLLVNKENASTQITIRNGYKE